MEFTIAFQSELIKDHFLKYQNCETLEESKQIIKYNNLIENIELLKESQISYCFVIINDLDKEYKFYSSEGNIEIDEYDSEGTGRFTKITDKVFEEAVQCFYEEVEDLMYEIMIMMQY